MMGGFVWSAFEYLGEAIWPRITSCSGVIDVALQRKDSFYQMKSFFTEEPMIHVLPHWNMEGRKNIRIVAYTNCAEAEVKINGRSLGKQSCEKYTANEWRADFEPGELRAIAYDKDGNVVAEDVKVTTGSPYALKLTFENEGDVCANSEDVALFTCTVLDSEGREVPDAECDVTFISDKGVRLVGTIADNADHVLPKSAKRRTYAGRALAAFQPAAAGEMTVYATCQGLKTAAITINVPENKKFELGRVYTAINVKW
jgi:beta-galactosidase